MVDGKVFATGTYSCSSTCTFTGMTLAGKPSTFTFTSSSLTGAKTGTLSLSQFASHGAWASAVAQWANANPSQNQRGLIVSAAALRILGDSPGHDPRTTTELGGIHPAAQFALLVEERGVGEFSSD
jgi:hypothetical protein